MSTNMTGGADGGIAIQVKLDTSKASKELTRLEQKILKLQEEVTVGKAKKSALVAQLEQANAELTALQAKTKIDGKSFVISPEDSKRISDLKIQIEQTQTAIEQQNKALSDAQLTLEGVKTRYGEVTQQAQALAAAEQETAGGSMQEAREHVEQTADAFAQAQWSAEELNDTMDGTQGSASRMEKAAMKVQKSMERIAKRIKSLFGQALFFGLISRALSSFRDWLGERIRQNDAATAAVSRLKGALLTLAQPILGVVLPAFTALVDALTRIVTMVAEFISILTGTSFSASKDAAKNLNEEKKALDGVGAAAASAEKSMAGFDEINKLSNSASGGGGGSAAKPDFSFDTSSMASDFEKILNWVNLIGAALLAWKLSKGFMDGLTKFVGLLVAIRGGIDLAKGAWDAWQNGVSMDNFLEMLKGAAELTLGLWIAFGKLGAGIGMVVSGLVMFATGLHDALENGWSFENMLSTVAGLLISGLGIAVLTGSWIPLLVAAIAGLLLVFTNAFGQGQAMLDGMKSLLQGFLDFFKGVFTGDLALTVQGIQLMVQGLQTIIEAVLTALQTAINALFNWLDEQTNGRLSGLIEWIKTFLNSWIETLKVTLNNMVNSIQQILTGVVTFISGVFAGNWKRAWDGIASILKGVWNLIVTIVENAINLVIDLINAMVRAFNDAFEPMRALTGFPPVIQEMSYVELPRLATGAVIPPNREFLAVLGDQKQGTNIETPLDTMVQAFRQALSEGGYSGQSTAYLVIDEDVLGKVVYRLNKSESNRVGVSLEDY